jgi:hypothetical protein
MICHFDGALQWKLMTASDRRTRDGRAYGIPQEKKYGVHLFIGLCFFGGRFWVVFSLCVKEIVSHDTMTIPFN